MGPAVIVEAVGPEWLIAMAVFFVLTLWWGFGGKRGGDGDGDGREK